jgi:hypothetical protein
MNLVKKDIIPGLKAWRKLGAKITYLKKGSLRVPEIFIKSTVQSDKLFLIATGFHLEETSGPLFLLNPKKSFPAIKRLLKKTNVAIFPVINQYGLAFSAKGEDKYLRYNKEGLNYNSAWGFNKKKCQEVGLVEKQLVELYKEYEIIFALSLHEDSTEPGKGYLWINNIVKDIREKIQTSLSKRVNKKLLLQIISTVGLRRGKIEKGFSVIDAHDDSFENYMSEILGIPTLLSEAPFGLDLKRRIAFHKASLASIPL